MIRIGLNAGHGLYTQGKQMLYAIDQKQTKEWWLNQRVVSKVQEKLKAYKVEVFRYDDPSGKRDIPLRERTTNANNDNLDFYLAVHYNAGVNGGSGGGVVVFRYPNNSAYNQKLQKSLYDHMIKETGLVGNRSTPLATANFHEVRETKMPSLLLENGFMDSSVDGPIILTEAHAEKSANAIVNFFVENFKLIKKEPKDYFIKGDKGQGVLDVQEKLYDLGYKLIADGLYGDETYKIVLQFQADNNLVADGVAGKLTQAKIDEKIEEKNKVKEDFLLPDGKYFRVVAGSYQSRNNAEEMQQKLKEAGLDSFLSIFEK